MPSQPRPATPVMRRPPPRISCSRIFTRCCGQRGSQAAKRCPNSRSRSKRWRARCPPPPSALEATADTPSVESAVPTETAALFRFLKDGGYDEFPAKESAVHASRGPHAKFGWPVRVFLDAKMQGSLKAGNASHPAGAAIVKEMYNEKGDRLMGWAVMVKTGSDSDGGKGWFWYETTNTRDAADVVAAGNGVPGCFGCHSTGADFVLTSFPLQ